MIMFHWRRVCNGIGSIYNVEKGGDKLEVCPYVLTVCLKDFPSRRSDTKRQRRLANYDACKKVFLHLGVFCPCD